MLTNEELKRYDRHIKLNEIGVSGQEKLKNSKILIVGAGGLGCPVLLYLAAAGVGTIGIIDHDVVDFSNLQRQILFTQEDIGKQKVDVVENRLLALNDSVIIETYAEAISNKNALNIIEKYNVVIDGTDNFETRYLVNDACIIKNKPLVFGSIFKFEGQITVFNYNNGPSYRCLYPEPPKEGEVPNCSDIGVLGVLPGIIGTQMANEALKIVLGIGKVLSGTLKIVNLLSNLNLDLKISKNEKNFEISELNDSYNFSCVMNKELKNTIEVEELKEWIDNKKDILILDVREQYELGIAKLPNILNIPLGTIPSNLNKIKNTTIITLCHHGIRSKSAQDYLLSNGFTNVINLEGGIHEWALKIDPEMEKY
jgi:sulfur-carrier protein adenylyltransferase/sulfurtransferase